MKSKPSMPLFRTLLLALSALLVACDAPSPIDKATSEKILLLGNTSEPQGLDPHLVSGVLESNIIRSLFEGLCVEHPSQNGVPLPGVAESWQPNDDFTEWIFHLRNDAQWSDGHPLTAEDFLFSFQRILNPRLASEYAFMLYYIQGAEDFHKNRRCKTLFSKNPDTPFDWSEVKKTLNFSGSKKEATTPFDKKGIDHLTTDELQQLQQNLALFTWPAALNPKSQSWIIAQLIAFDQSGKSLWDRIGVGATAPDAHTLRIQLRAPIPYLTELTKHYTWYPVPKHIVLKHGSVDDRFSKWTQPGNLVSNGPFTLQSWRINDHIFVKKNPRYWDAPQVQLEGIRFFPISNVYTEARMFYNDQLHVTYTLGSELIEYSKKKYPQQTRNELYLGTFFVRCNVTRPPLDNPKVRRALSLALDRQSLIDHVLQGGQKPTTGLVPPSDQYASPDIIRYDPEAARRLLAEAGYPDGKGFPDIRLLTTDRESAKRMAEAFQGMWQQNLNISIGIDQREWVTYLSTMSQKEYDLAGGGWIGDYLDPTTFLDLWIKNGGNNRTGWSNANYEKILSQAEQQADQEKRMQLLQKAESLLLKERPILPIYWYTRNYLLHPHVKNWHPLLLDNHPYKFVRLEDK
ncbi:MAG: peptide ABC transporter substrate-binding protein [Verrucomicrobiales bacterium]|nr:peptide ABC transporter substrate-binding protein [Verrucomicrobiales bacterium]